MQGATSSCDAITRVGPAEGEWAIAPGFGSLAGAPQGQAVSTAVRAAESEGRAGPAAEGGAQ
ncbi:hypothetical protein, partial [Erwinia amylovora]|uniref:hypothetical protein n=1 Tax=Erwinia amylovora TaxID=552 RepID=UPI0020C1744A